MALPLLEQDSGSGLAIGTEQAMGSFTAARDVMVYVDIRLTLVVNTAANFTVRVLKRSAVPADIKNEGPFTEPKFAAGDTVYGPPLIGPIAMRAGEILVPYIMSSVADTVNWEVDYYDAFAKDAVMVSGGATEADRLQAALGTGNYIAADVTLIEGADPTDTLEAAAVAAITIIETTVVSAGSTSDFVITSDIAFDDEYNGNVIAVRDAIGGQWEVRRIVASLADVDVVYVDRALTFLPAAGDLVRIMATGYGDVNVTHLAGSAIQQASGYIKVSAGAGTGQISLSSGAVTVGTNNDKTGYKLASDGLASVTTWTVGITGTVSGNSTHNAAAVKTALEADGSKLDHLWEMTEDDGGTRRLTANALENVFVVDMDQVEGSGVIDSLCTLVLAAFHGNLVDNAGKLTVYRTDGTTEVNQFDITSSDTASPTTGVSN